MSATRAKAARAASYRTFTMAEIQEADFMEYAKAGVNTDEFDRLIGLAGAADKAEKAEEAPAQQQEKSRLPEM